MRQTSAPQSTLTPTKGGVKKAKDPRSFFIAAVIDMSWKLAIAVLLPIIAGVELDNALKTKNVFTFIGLALAVIGSAAVMWRAMQAANRLPVPKLSAAQKRAIKKSYEDEDKDE